MEELRKELNAAYKLIDAVPVRGDMIEIMFEARKHLRKAYKLAEDFERRMEEDNG